MTEHPKMGWTERVNAYSGLVWSIARGMRLSQEDAEDVFQNTWLLIYRHMEDIRDEKSIAGWIATTTRREALLVRRRAQLRGDVEAIHSQEAGVRQSDTPDDEVRQLEDSVLISTALLELSTRCQVILGKLYFSAEELTYEKLAAQLEMPLGSLGPTRKRCLEHLASILEGKIV